MTMRAHPPPPSARPRTALATALLCGLLWAGTPTAQADTLFLNMASDSAMMAQSVAAHMGMAAVSKSYYPKGTSAPAAPKAQDSARTALAMGTDRRISQQVKQHFRDGLVRANPGETRAIDEALAKDWLAGYRSDIARPNGLDARNFADVYVGYIIANWAIVHQRDTISPKSIAAVQQTVRQQLRNEGALAAMGADERQRAGESMVYQTTLIMANREALAKAGRTARRQEAAEHYRRLFLQDSGVDLARLALTDQGFVSR